MSGKRYTDEFKAEAVRFVTEQGHPAREVAARLGISEHSMYRWLREARQLPGGHRGRSVYFRGVYLTGELTVDLYSRRVVGWSMQKSPHRSLAINALLMAVRRRRPQADVLIHSDQGSQYGSDDWMRFCRDHGLVPSMSRRGNC